VFGLWYWRAHVSGAAGSRLCDRVPGLGMRFGELSVARLVCSAWQAVVWIVVDAIVSCAPM